MMEGGSQNQVEVKRDHFYSLLQSDFIYLLFFFLGFGVWGDETVGRQEKQLLFVSLGGV